MIINDVSNSCQRCHVCDVPKTKIDSKTFVQYVEKHCPGYSVRQARKLVSEGKKVHVLLQKGLELSCHDKTKAISSLMWYLMWHAVKHDQGFTEGTFVVKDPGHRLEKFFASSSSCYRRLMSHFPGRTKQDTFLWVLPASNTYALDIVQDGKWGLPAHKRTVIWSALETLDEGEYTFFKVEDWGTKGLVPFVKHSLDFICYLPRLLFPGWLGKHNNPLHREEHLPPDILKKFQSVIEKSHLTKAHKDIHKYGLAGIVKTLSALPKIPQQAASLLLDLYKNYPDLQQSPIRSGREIVIH